MHQSSFSNGKGPTKPPLKNGINNSGINNILSSIPNSSQLATIANAALQNIISIPATPPPPPVHLLQSIQSNTHNTNSYTSNNNNNRLPPGLPIPIPIHPMSSIGNISSSPIPIVSSSSNMVINGHNINENRKLLTNTTPTTIRKTTTTTATTKKKKRGKRGNKKRMNKKETDKKDEGDDEDLDCTEIEEEEEAIEITKRNLINAIELERRNHELTKIRLVQLHKHYGNMLKNLKQESKYLTNKINILKNGPSQNDLEVILRQKQDLRNEYLRKRAIRVKDEQQLKQTNKENQKLVIIIHYLKQQLDALLTQYQSLCAKQTGIDNENPAFTDAQRIVNNLDSLDIVDAESMVNQETNKLLNGNNPSNAIAQRINDDPWFQKVIEENRMLERHIRFLRHIIERETQRCNFKEIIVGKKLVSPEKKQSEETI